MFFSSSTTRTVRGAGCPGGGLDGVLDGTCGRAPVSLTIARLGASLAQVPQVVARLHREPALPIVVHDRLEGLPRLGPLVHLEVGLPEKQKSFGGEVVRDADAAGFRR